jgi:hypothetical protein
MTAVLYDDVVTGTTAPRLAPAPRPAKRQSTAAGGDPLVDAATHLLTIPLRQVYAVLWRVGLIEVTA